MTGRMGVEKLHELHADTDYNYRNGLLAGNAPPADPPSAVPNLLPANVNADELNEFFLWREQRNTELDEFRAWKERNPATVREPGAFGVTSRPGDPIGVVPPARADVVDRTGDRTINRDRDDQRPPVAVSGVPLASPREVETGTGPDTAPPPAPGQRELTFDEARAQSRGNLPEPFKPFNPSDPFDRSDTHLSDQTPD